MDYEAFISEWNSDSPTVLVHTSGSTGKPKPMLVEKSRMRASARITCDFLHLQPGDTALLCMSLDYIAGKMMVVRALERQLRLISVPPSSHPLQSLVKDAPRIDFAAMVPMQVVNSLQVLEEEKLLRSAKHLIIGGGAVDATLAARLADFPNAVWSTYGMTETLSHIALRRLNGAEATEWYTPFEGVHISLDERGCLVIDAPHVCADRLVTNDIAVIENGKFRIVGRIDNVICSGGIKIQMEKVEAQLRPHLHSPFMVTKCADATLGEAMVLITEDEDTEAVMKVCGKVLTKYEIPRHVVHVAHVPLTETGKPARGEALTMISGFFS